MSNPTTHPPSQIVYLYLVAAGHVAQPVDGVFPAIDGAAWPGCFKEMPSTPDDLIGVYDTEPQLDTKSLRDGEHTEHAGVQVIVRAADNVLADAKSRALAQLLDTARNVTVTIDGTNYSIGAMMRTSGVIELRRKDDELRRYSINVLVDVQEV